MGTRWTAVEQFNRRDRRTSPIRDWATSTFARTPRFASGEARCSNRIVTIVIDHLERTLFPLAQA
jgi:hypothetical protein